MKIPSIAASRHWSAASVRQVCIDNDLYTCGDNDDYEAMLDFVNHAYPDVENLYLVAKNILDHSRSGDQTITNIMFVLENDVVKTTFEINESEEGLK